METILFLGLGRIGLPQALIFAAKGFRVYGYDSDSDLITTLGKAQAPFQEIQIEQYLQQTLNQSFFPTASWSEITCILPSCTGIIFTIGTRAPDAKEAIEVDIFGLETHFSLLDKIFSVKQLPKKIKLIVRTTLPLGGTDRLKNYLEEKLGLKEGYDFYFSFVPERLVVGHAIEEEQSLPILIGAYSDEGFAEIKHLFEKIGGPIVRVANPITAEFCKLTDNSFRDTLFAFANEMAIHAAQYGIDTNEVIHAVNYQYPRNNIPKPGYVSGYCLRKDPYLFEMGFLSKLNQNYPRDFHSLWYYGRKTNDFLISYTALKIMHHLKDLDRAVVAVVGLSFKEDVDDFRMSDSFSLINFLIQLKISHFKVYDPNLEVDKYTMLPEHLQPFIVAKASVVDQDFFEDVTSIVICHSYHDLLDFNHQDKLTRLLQKVDKPCFLFDACNIWREAEKVEGIIYQGLGYDP